MNELKSCPFCDGAIRLTHGDFLTSSIAMFKCEKCGAVITFDEPVCNAGAMNHDDTPAIEAFNTRYEPTCHNSWKEDIRPGMFVTGGQFECSECGFMYGYSELPYGYCPGCGRKVVD